MKPTIVLLGHGSQNKDSQAEFSELRELVQRIEPEVHVLLAYLQLCEPSLDSILANLANQRITEVIIIPVFLFAGNHIQQDIPELICQLLVKYPTLHFKVGHHLGPDVKIVQLVLERVQEVIYRDTYLKDPIKIEDHSFKMIETMLSGIKNSWSEMEREIVKRVVHTTADPGMAKLMDFHPEAIQAGLKALQDGSRIITDVKMAATGIGTKPTLHFQCPVECYIDDPEVVRMAQTTGKTRAMSAMLRACQGLKNGIVVVGNAPTALFQLFEMIEAGEAKPELIVGTPVGFVGAAESKEVLKNVGIPYIRTIGPRGGSPIAAAIVNALCKLAEPTQ